MTLCVQAVDVYTSAGYGGTLNISQQIDRMAHSNESILPCITPAAALYIMKEHRTLTGRVCVRKQFFIVDPILQFQPSKSFASYNRLREDAVSRIPDAHDRVASPGREGRWVTYSACFLHMDCQFCQWKELHSLGGNAAVSVQ